MRVCVCGGEQKDVYRGGEREDTYCAADVDKTSTASDNWQVLGKRW